MPPPPQPTSESRHVVEERGTGIRAESADSVVPDAVIDLSATEMISRQEGFVKCEFIAVNSLTDYCVNGYNVSELNRCASEVTSNRRSPKSLLIIRDIN